MMVCRTCLAQVRFGWRHGQPGWWHREDVDHPGFPVVEPPEREVIDIPEPEVRSTPVTPGHEKVPGGVRTVTNLLAKIDGWELRRLTYARGPYVGSKGEVLSTSDSVVLGAQGEVDNEVRVAVASWRDAKFDFAYIGIIKDSVMTTYPANSNELRSWIKGTHDLPDAVQSA